MQCGGTFLLLCLIQHSSPTLEKKGPFSSRFGWSVPVILSHSLRLQSAAAAFWVRFRVQGGFLLLVSRWTRFPSVLDPGHKTKIFYLKVLLLLDMSQRCLDFEADILIHSQEQQAKPSHTTEPSDGNATPLPVPAVRSRVPFGIGLHLNSLGTFSAPPKSQITNCETSKAFPVCSAESGRSLAPHLQQAIAEIDEVNILGTSPLDEAPPLKNRNHEKKRLLSEDNGNKPLPKRRRKSSTIEGNCKRCSCKKSKCLKLYCECFASGSFCLDSCACRDCSNKPEREETVLEVREHIKSRNPLAFAPRVIPSATACADTENQESFPAASKHKRGCNCKRSMCLKKYCECFQSEVGCSDSCKCVSCKNTFGMKQGQSDYGAMAVDSEDAADAYNESLLGPLISAVASDEDRALNLPAKDLESPLQQASTCSKSSSNFHTFGTPLQGIYADVNSSRHVSPEQQLSGSRTGTPEPVAQRPKGPRTNLMATTGMAFRGDNTTTTATNNSQGAAGGFTSVITVSSNERLRSNSLRPGFHTLQSKVLEEGGSGMPDFLLDPSEVESPTVTSSPKKKRITASQVGVPGGKMMQLPPVLKNGRKLTLQALPSLPPVSLIRENSIARKSS